MRLRLDVGGPFRCSVIQAAASVVRASASRAPLAGVLLLAGKASVDWKCDSRDVSGRIRCEPLDRVGHITRLQIVKAWEDRRRPTEPSYLLKIGGASLHEMIQHRGLDDRWAHGIDCDPERR